jgi:hypothetical protein
MVGTEMFKKREVEIADVEGEMGIGTEKIYDFHGVIKWYNKIKRIY